MTHARYRELSEHIQGVFLVAGAVLYSIFRVVDENKIIRRVSLGITMWLTVTATQWSMAFAEAHPDGQGWMIGAVMGPLGLLQAAVFKFYADSRGVEEAAKIRQENGDDAE